MEIDLNTSRVPWLPAPPNTERVQPAATLRDGVTFGDREALQKAMKDIPDVRKEVLERARAYAGQVKYPPDETITRIANLLAMHV